MLLIEKDLRGSFSKDRFCHQFVLGSAFVDALQGWQRVPVDESFNLTVHPEIAVEQVSDATRSITVIGQIFDPRTPGADNAGVARALFDVFSSVERLMAATAVCGGRWIIIAYDAERKAMFTDALGLRQVFYTTGECSRGFWVASQPGLLGWLFELRVDATAEKFIDSLEFRRHREYRWPGTATPFREIVRLLPNHYLDLCTGQCHRYWPDRALQEEGFDEAIEKAAGLLQGMMRAVHARFDVVIGMTAGFDSRIVLAASSAIRKGVAGVTVRQGGMPDNHQDIAVAARVLGKAGISREVIKALPYMSAEFSKAFKQNVFLAHDHYGQDVEAILHRFGRTKVVVTGSGAEVVREPFRKKIDAEKREITARDLATLQSMGECEFAVDSFQRWLGGIGERYNIHLLDLFSWEQSHGNWLAATQMEFDLAWRDMFTPFNCRELLTTMLSIDARYRSSPRHRAFYALIEKMWPDLLDEPINPDKSEGRGSLRKTGRSVKNAIKSRLVRRGIKKR